MDYDNNKFHKVTFSFYGIGVCLESDDGIIVKAIEHDFSYFASSLKHSSLRIIYHCQKPDYTNLPMMTSSLIRPDNIVFRSENKTYIDYFGRAINICDREENTSNIYTEDRDLGHEIVYLTILSRVSELLDKRHIHRIHALGLEYNGQGILLLLPWRGGKTTLAMSILEDRQNGIRLLSDESPLIKTDGTLLPFPLRIGVCPEDMPLGIEGKFIGEIKQRGYAPKVTIDIKYFSSKVCSNEVKPAIILLGSRSTADISRIEAVPKIMAIKSCSVNSVMGEGLYQGPEFVGENRLFNLFTWTGTRFSRAYNNLRLISKSKVFSFIIGKDIRKNYAALIQFLK